MKEDAAAFISLRMQWHAIQKLQKLQDDQDQFSPESTNSHILSNKYFQSQIKINST